MLGAPHSSRVNTSEIKAQIESKVGKLKAQKYFELLTKFLSCKISKSDFDRLCTETIGKQNVRLHNHFLRSILKNANLSKMPPPKEAKADGAFSVKVPNGYHKGGLQTLCREVLQSPRRGRSVLSERKFRDCPSPLGPHVKSHKVAVEELIPRNQEQQSASELVSLSSRPPQGSVEDGEEVNQAAGSPGIYSRSPVKAPLGIPVNNRKRKLQCNPFEASDHMETCYSTGELPDTNSLGKRLKQKLEMEGLKVSVDCLNLLNLSLDAYMKRLIKPCLDLARSRGDRQKQTTQGYRGAMPGLNVMQPLGHLEKPSGSRPVSIQDFRTAMELNPQILGVDWPTQLEKVCFRASESYL